MRVSAILAAVAVGGLVTTAAIAMADRPPNAAEKAAIEKTLRAQGYVSWEEVELDDDGPYWEVDDARKKDGARWDVRLKPGSYQVIRAKIDD